MNENKMGTKPVWSLLLGMALPVMLSTAVQSLYNVVDGIFVSQLGEYALAAISFSSPLVNIMTAVGSGIAVGMNTMLSHALGEKDQQKADGAVTAALWVWLGAGIIAAAAAFTLSAPYLHMMTSDPVIYEAGLQYIHICMGLAIMPMGQLVFERMLIATGKTTLSMISQGVGGILNMGYLLVYAVLPALIITRFRKGIPCSVEKFYFKKAWLFMKVEYKDPKQRLLQRRRSFPHAFPQGDEFFLCKPIILYR